MLPRVAKYIASERLLGEGGKVVVGLSGGADSVFLLYTLKELGYRCLAAHCNFRLRGEESERDEYFSENFAKTLQIPFLCRAFDTVKIAKERKVSVEMAARDLRYEWFEELRRSEGAEVVAVAHHSDDSIETLLLNLIRGTGIRGLTGIMPSHGFVIRPLLCLSKADILHFLKEKDLSYVTDSTNLQDEFIRNRIRLQLLPLLETFNPSIRGGLLGTAQNISEATKVYDSAIKECIDRVFDREKGRINISLLRTCPSPRSVLFEILKDCGFSGKTIEDVYRSVDSQSGKTFYSSDLRLTKDRDEFIISPVTHNDGREEYEISEGCCRLDFPFSMEVLVADRDSLPEIERGKNVATLDFDRLRFPLILRRWRFGDRFVPFGMSHFQKLSDFFTSNKVSRPDKDNVWVLLSGDDIVWVAGHRIDNRFRVGESTGKVLILFRHTTDGD
ncbi:MAG: tRNA lysidine(34) synthetase TilS [Dysgonamonadaceae bacterium]|jgi:tRNA(Ile)-lysidine synthase|nr:tRNA lysidine(34) synthetase TilS [Dysgonamonadaceae bacterium]